ncbi:hypothetical protein FACS1894125_6000 [Actinomycetota bacterium]|nr:hypothetical protein FACS1894125_6000 [Actinomycetota bacterium]
MIVMGKRIGTGLILGAIVLVCIFVYPFSHPLLLIGLLCVAAIISILELSHAFKSRDIYTPVAPLIVISCSMIVSAYYPGEMVEMVIFIVGGSILFFYSSLNAKVTNRHSGFMSGIFILTYIPLMLSFYIMISELYQGSFKLVLVILASVTSDIGGLLFGSIFGKHRMTPNISPNKTWEGLGGSLLLSTVSTVIFGYFAFNEYFYSGKTWILIILPIIITLVGTFGDLIESTIKRECNMKDMGDFLPGHGGILDRLDALIIIAPFSYFFMAMLMG